MAEPDATEDVLRRLPVERVADSISDRIGEFVDALVSGESLDGTGEGLTEAHG